MSLVTDLTPLNYSSEKAKFLADPTFNPKFEYIRNFSQEELNKFGLPKDKYLKLAKNIISKALENSSPRDIFKKNGEILTKETVEKNIISFLKKHQLEDRFQIVWSEKFTSRTSVNSNSIKLRLPCSIQEQDLTGLIYHELGTHILRRINYEKQPWFKKKRKFGFTSYLKTEEGLAILHSLLERKNLFAYSAAVNYLAVNQAQIGDFLSVYKLVFNYFPNPEKAFNIAFKKKRGLTDISKPGGFTKDLVYFEGFVEVVNFLIKKNFPLEELYFGKLAWQDIVKAVEMNPHFKPVMPDFYTDNPEKYKAKIKKIAEINGITT